LDTLRLSTALSHQEFFGLDSKSASYLKGKNAAYLWSFIGANLAIFLSLVVSRQFASSSIDHFWERVTTKDGIIAACIPILAIVLSGVLSDSGKARLVFWRWRNPLPVAVCSPT
jgi:hypothetical protein